MTDTEREERAQRLWRAIASYCERNRRSVLTTGSRIGRRQRRVKRRGTAK